MGRVTGWPRSRLSRAPRPAPRLMPWEVRYQHRMEEFFKAPQVTSNASQEAGTPTLMQHGSAHETVSHNDSEPFVMNSLVIHGTNSSKDCSGGEVTEEKQENCEREICESSIISDHGQVKPPSVTEASVQVAELPNSPTGRQSAAAAGSGGRASRPGTPPHRRPGQAEGAFSPNVKQRTIVLKTIKYAINYNLDEFFNYAFAPGKVSLKRRLVDK